MSNDSCHGLLANSDGGQERPATASDAGRRQGYLHSQVDLPLSILWLETPPWQENNQLHPEQAEALALAAKALGFTHCAVPWDMSDVLDNSDARFDDAGQRRSLKCCMDQMGVGLVASCNADRRWFAGQTAASIDRSLQRITQYVAESGPAGMSVGMITDFLVGRDDSTGQPSGAATSAVQLMPERVEALQRFTESLRRQSPHTFLIAVDSEACPLANRPVRAMGGLGFDFVVETEHSRLVRQFLLGDDNQRREQQRDICDVVSHPLTEDIIFEMHSWRESLEDDARILANARVLTGWLMMLPGKKAARVATACQIIDHARRVGGNREMALSNEVAHARWLRDLHQVYREYPTLYREYGENFEWIECRDSLHGVIGFARRNPECAHEFLVVANLSCHRFDDYRMGTPSETMWTEIFNSEWIIYGGTSQDAPQMIRSERLVTSGRPHSIGLRLFPNSIAIFHGLRQVVA